MLPAFPKEGQRRQSGTEHKPRSGLRDTAAGTGPTHRVVRFARRKNGRASAKKLQLLTGFEEVHRRRWQVAHALARARRGHTGFPRSADCK